MEVVLDSNILISVLNRNDCGHAESVKLIEKLDTDQYEILAPALFLWEFSAYQHHPEKSKIHSQNIDAKFRVSTIDVTVELFWHTHSEAMVNISGADRVFVSVARAHSAPLVTNDVRVLKNADKLGVRAISVSDFLTYSTDNSFTPKPLCDSAF